MCQEILLAFTQSQSQTHDTKYKYNPQVMGGVTYLNKIYYISSITLFDFMTLRRILRLTRPFFFCFCDPYGLGWKKVTPLISKFRGLFVISSIMEPVKGFTMGWAIGL